MNKREFIVTISAILSTLRETGGGPESSIYLALGMDLAKWQALRHALESLRFIRVSGHYVTLTDDGRRMAEKIDAAVASAT